MSTSNGIDIEFWPVIGANRKIAVAGRVNGTHWSPAELEKHSRAPRECKCGVCIRCRVRAEYRIRSHIYIQEGLENILDLSPNYAFIRHD